MQGYQKCNNGHFYKDSMASCPYCSEGSGSSGGGSDSTMVVGGGAGVPPTVTENIKTEAYASTGSSTEHLGDRTMVFAPGSAGSAAAKSSPAPAAKPGIFDRTFIGGMPTPGETEIVSGNPSEAPRSTRKIVGWIISYTLDEMGVDYRIFEGNNTIGRDAANSIMLSNESTISGKHMTILFRGGNFWAKDEMSANGSFLNGVEMEIQKAYPIKDNDELRLGNTVFKFKSAI